MKPPSLGFTAKVYTPVFDGANTNLLASLFRNDIFPDISAYNQTKEADGGMIQGSVSLTTSQTDADEWLRTGLGTYLVITTQSGIAFTALVNKVTVANGRVTQSAGPLLDVYNRVMSIYNPWYVDETPAYRGATRATILVENTDSQRRWGIRERVLNVGDAIYILTPYFNAAEQARDVYLAKYANPRSGGDSFSSSASNFAAITLELLGLRTLLDVYWYLDSTEGHTTVSGDGGKINLVLDSDPNGIFQYNKYTVQDNPVLTTLYEADYKYAGSVIQDAAAMGGPGDDYTPWHFGIYHHGTAYFSPVPSTVRYALSASDNAVDVVDLTTGDKIHPANVNPNEWAIIVDTIHSGGLEANLIPDGNDPRFIYVNNASYSYPNDLSLNGEAITPGNLSAMIKQLGLGGL